MQKFISLMNKQTFYYLWQNKPARRYLIRLINTIIKSKETYFLYDTFNSDNNLVRSYIFLESKNNLIFIDFNHDPERALMNLDLNIVKFLEIASPKKVLIVIFNSFTGKNLVQGQVYQVYNNHDNSSDLRLLLSQTRLEQEQNNQNNIIEYLDSLDDEFYQKYLKETTKEENIYKFFDL